MCVLNLLEAVCAMNLNEIFLQPYDVAASESLPGPVSSSFLRFFDLRNGSCRSVCSLLALCIPKPGQNDISSSPARTMFSTLPNVDRRVSTSVRFTCNNKDVKSLKAASKTIEPITLKIIETTTRRFDYISISNYLVSKRELLKAQN